MSHGLAETHRLFLSTLPARPRERRLALMVVGASLAICIAIAPFAKVKLAQVWAFIPVYQSAVVINDLITAALLFGQFTFVRSQALCVLAGGYLFTALMAAAHALSFPGLFAPTGLLSGGPQSTAWIYMFWHGVFPMFVIGYALLKNERLSEETPRAFERPILACVGAVALLASVLTAVATAGHDSMPAIMRGSTYTPSMLFVVTSVWVLSAVALLVLWRRKPHSVLDVWMMVVMCAWMIDIALAAVLNGGRFDLGFYAGRIYGLLAASFILIVLLVENGSLYARLAATHERARRGRERLQKSAADLVQANKELESFSYSVSHDLRAPLRAIDGYSRMLEEDYGATLDAEANRLLSVIRANSAKMGHLIDDLLTLSRLGRQEMMKTEIAMDRLAKEVIDEALDQHRETRARIAVLDLPPARGDRALLRQVWVNLISNALKYTGRVSEPRIEVSGYRDGTENVYRIHDNGAGFDMQYYGKLFGVFQRLHRSEDFSGTGVGLAIVHRVVIRHLGRVWAEGRPNEGATFYFALPAE